MINIILLYLASILTINCINKNQLHEDKSPSSYKHFKLMNYDELKAKKSELIEKNNKTAAINYCSRMLELSKDLNEIRELRIEIANLYFDTNDFKEAKKRFVEFVKLYPNHKSAEDAASKAIESTWMLSLSPDRDPSDSYDAIDMANDFLKNNHYQEKRELVKNIKTEAQVKLLCKEINTIEFYLKQKNTKAVEKRIEHIKKEFKELIDQNILKIEPIENYLCAVKKGEKKEIKIAQEKLHECYSGTCMLHHDPKLHKKVVNPKEALKPRKTMDYFTNP